MDRRGFLKLFSAGVAGVALDQAIPLGRVWSFPKNIVISKPLAEFTVDIVPGPLFEIGDVVQIETLQQLFVVSRVLDGKIDLSRCGLTWRGVDPKRVRPLLELV